MNEDVKPQKFTSITEYLEARGYKIEEEAFVNPDDKDDKILFAEISRHTPMTLAEKHGWKR